MAFLAHLFLLVVGIVLIVWFFRAPKTVLFIGSVLGCGYLGSSEGFIGTALGLLAGCVVGGAIVGTLVGIRLAYRWLTGADEQVFYLGGRRPHGVPSED